LGWLTKT
jgi:hypothetical protein